MVNDTRTTKYRRRYPHSHSLVHQRRASVLENCKSPIIHGTLNTTSNARYPRPLDRSRPISLERMTQAFQADSEGVRIVSAWSANALPFLVTRVGHNRPIGAGVGLGIF